jgi:hypothetical protein
MNRALTGTGFDEIFPAVNAETTADPSPLAQDDNYQDSLQPVTPQFLVTSHTGA